MRNRDNDRCTKAGQRHDEDGRRNEYNNYRNGRNNLESKQKQLDNECHKYSWDIRRPMKLSYASSTYPENYIPAVMPPLNPTSPPSTVATFLATRHMVVLQPSGYSVFHGGDTPIQLSLP